MKCPQSVLCPVRYNVKTFSLNWQNQDIRLSTSRGKISISFTVPEFSCKYQGYPVATADLLYRQGKWWVHVVVRVPEPVFSPNDEVIGIDLGLNHPGDLQSTLPGKPSLERSRASSLPSQTQAAVQRNKVCEKTSHEVVWQATAIPQGRRSCPLQTPRSAHPSRSYPRL